MRSVGVEIQLGGTWQALGQIRTETKRGFEYGAFGYSDYYLALKNAYPIEPTLRLHRGFFNADRSLHGAFRDAAPDRWGRNLIARSIRNSRPQGTISELDYLLGVSDFSRVGNFRFASDQPKPIEPEIPTLLTLPKVLRLSEELESSDSFEVTKALLGVGSASLGGARPKSSVIDDGNLFIAKFPHANDDWDVMAWEAWSLGLAREFGLLVPDFKTVTIDGKTVLLLSRFDRRGEKRIGYISAMTMLGKNDGDPADYLEIVEAIINHGVEVGAQLRELWKRILLSVVIRNNDDHLRNHGFLRTRGGWSLSPVFDINPTPTSEGFGRSTSIAGAVGTEAELATLIDLSGLFGLGADQARSLASKLKDLLTTFSSPENLPPVPKRERDLMMEIFTSSIFTLDKS